MGIHGIYKEIGPGQRIALSKYSVQHYEQHSRPLRLAIDIQIWLFQIQSGKGGSNPALRTFYYRLLRLLSLNIHPLFVFDGPGKPLFKRNKRVGGPGVKVASVPEFLAKQLLKQFGFPMHIAPGEAEAECALLQWQGVVDAVLSEDVDTLMFGSGTTMRSWTPEAKSSKVPTHVNVYDSNVTKQGSGLDREGMILVALMSGGDYIPEGIPGCGPKTACEAARAGFGAELCKLKKRDDAGFKEWRDRLKHELWTNESKLFKQKRKVEIPEDFPNREVLGYYTNPCISSNEKVEQLRRTLKWDMPIDFASLRSFAGDAFDWICIGGAKKFIRNLAPAILTRELRMRAEQGANDGGDLETQASAEERLVTAIHGKRSHASTDQMLEIRISFLPMNLVPIDLSIEPPDELPQSLESDSEEAVNDEADQEAIPPPSPRKRGPSKYNPEDLEKIWIMDAFLRQGVPLKVQDWEASFRDPKTYLQAKRAAKEATAPKKKGSGMPRGALDRFTTTMKPGVDRTAGSKTNEVDSGIANSQIALFNQRNSRTGIPMTDDQGLESIDLSAPQPAIVAARLTKRSSPDSLSPGGRKTKARTGPTRDARQPTIINLLSSPMAPLRHSSPLSQGRDLGSQSPVTDNVIELPDTVTQRKRRSPFKRYETAPAVLEDVDVSPTLRPSRYTYPASEDELEPLDLSRPGVSKLILQPVSRPTVPLTQSRPSTTNQAPFACPVSENELEPVDLSGRILSKVALSPASKATALSPQSQTSKNDSNSITRPNVPSDQIEAVDLSLTATASCSQMTMQGKAKVKKRHYQLRESLEGHFREVVEEVEVDMTGPEHNPSSTTKSSIMKPFTLSAIHVAKDKALGASANAKTGSTIGKDRSRWRHSEVEVLDLTAL